MGPMISCSERDGHPLPCGLRIAVATARGRPYYYFSALLNRLGVAFDSLLPEQMRTYAGHLVLTTESEFLGPGRCSRPVLLFEDVAGSPPAVVCGMMMRRIGACYGGCGCSGGGGKTPADDLIIGIDPGQRNGLSISYCGHEIESSVHPSVDNLVSQVIRVFGGLPARRRLVRIGDGDMKTANEIARVLNLRFCSSFDLEFVDESRTSPKIKHFNCRGRRDILSARHISRRDGRHRQRTVMPLSMTG